ncbi:hypothetical protein BDA96_08G089300 [Sorghum bicolor]|uniref:C2H2-type domain-containing protein n=2 Tax=Sorghum bicolor TaxID=4558 RepID=A0A921U7M8_SORBI|nr:uncharacterized protein LOC8086126 [Sorghum bicolor]XP_021302043.1 uncharacterized protein LOC8086126 [Sorghum bicolor]XP_021302044.1 uncharacterized protein LOC8086126 [Sorghum bicolor]EES15888.1 hypothetical protein SORBI_3008G083000 [Sorghum bicolor]KAG0520615.1 hypothetical protein BDA96_08G089300 [Sorghum bicolor]KAG0520616.1 hypothetical protein BDA96_08G089300 [Sorghum bicolor]KXG23314.1 hypothetical protein SORBI_3008G083000 [Sorghum bicolor]|eukprot:XP_002442050.1 uncharacterized protein LOC8086126 [Sorghum bicolor]
MLCCAGHLAPLLLLALFSVSSLLFVDGSHQDQEFREAVGSRILLQTNPDAHEVHCSRERSRAAWEAIDEYLMPFVEKEKYELPSKCRLRPDNDMFREQEQHKIHFDINEWHCGFCKKAFRAEKFLDQHFENRHKNLVDNSEGRCMADLCGALHCDLMMQFKKPKSKCNAAAATRNRHLCESLADSCFPVNQGLAASRLHEFFLRQFCDAHTCNKGTKPFPKGGRKQTNRFYLALCILTLILLPLFYLIVFLHQREMRKGTQDLKRFSKIGQKKKPS